MAIVKSKFKNSVSEKRWIELHKEKSELQLKKKTAAIEEKIELVNSMMTACKTGFNMTEAKVKKVIKFLKEQTGSSKIKYGILPEDIKTISILFKDTVILYVDMDGSILFKEHD